jgi:hypothetical protein
MRIFSIVAFGSRRLSLKYKRHALGMPTCMRNDGESRWPTILGIAMCGGSGGGKWFALCCRC